MHSPASLPPFPQRSFDDLGTPLHEVTFCVLDFETTGGDPHTCFVTEVGAVKVRGGEVLGTFHSLVNPGCRVPPKITLITGITDQLVATAPAMSVVLPALLEFIGGSVLVGHNVRFDASFLQAAIRRWGGPLLGNQQLDTLALARRLLVDEVPRFSLGELARRLRLPHQPSHRALDDALATTDLLHYLIERAAFWGVTGLDDLVALPTIAGHPQARKLALTRPLPRRPGVYRFHDRDGTTLYVGKATDLRSRVRSYFSSDRRRKVAQLLRETHDISWEVHSSVLAAELEELRLIQTLQPRFNRRGRRPTRPIWVRLDVSERLPRLSVTRSATANGILIGPLSSRRHADGVIEAVETALPLRRCRTKISRRTELPVASPCAAGQLGNCACPCSGLTGEQEYAEVVALAQRALTTDPTIVTTRLDERMRRLAAEERFEEAAACRDRADRFVQAMVRQRKLEMIGRAGRLEVESENGLRIVLGPSDQRTELSSGTVAVEERGTSNRSIAGEGTKRDETTDTPMRTLDETLCVSRWLDRHVTRLRLVDVDGELSSPLPALPSFTPKQPEQALD